MLDGSRGRERVPLGQGGLDRPQGLNASRMVCESCAVNITRIT
jgi:hypothetical protein